jgi:hypothetical protein
VRGCGNDDFELDRTQDSSVAQAFEGDGDATGQDAVALALGSLSAECVVCRQVVNMTGRAATEGDLPSQVFSKISRSPLAGGHRHADTLAGVPLRGRADGRFQIPVARLPTEDALGMGGLSD